LETLEYWHGKSDKNHISDEIYRGVEKPHEFLVDTVARLGINPERVNRRAVENCTDERPNSVGSDEA
jgi:hypothetical protein